MSQVQKHQTTQELPWLTSGPAAFTNDPCHGVGQSVETRAVKGHTWKANEHAVEIIPYDLPKIPTLKALRLEDQCQLLSMKHAYTFPHPFSMFCLPFSFS